MVCNAQPAARRAQQNTANKAAQPKSNADNMTQRALISFPTQQTMQEDVVWRRDIYRELDLTKDENSGLYYPVEPVGSQMNLFTYMFKLMLTGKIPAYEYRIDGNISFDNSAKIKPLTFLDNYHIYYERGEKGLKLDDSDIPSREVKSYYIKEAAYYDQYSSTFHKKVVALCPIMSREDDFGDGVAKYPLFWVKYEDIAPFLSKQMIMTSNLNNAATMSIDDYFVKNKYKGEIYKTNNMLGQTLAQYCPTDSAMKKEQERIEAELIAFEKGMWGKEEKKDSTDSLAVTTKGSKPKKKAPAKKTASSATVAKSQKTSKSKPAASSGSARVTVRRQRH